jgi:hypothetical protein
MGIARLRCVGSTTHVEPTLTAALGYRANTEATGKATAADYLQQLLSTTFTVIALAA